MVCWRVTVLSLKKYLLGVSLEFLVPADSMLDLKWCFWCFRKNGNPFWKISLTRLSSLYMYCIPTLVIYFSFWNLISLLMFGMLKKSGFGAKSRILWKANCNTGFCIPISINNDGIQSMLLHSGEHLDLFPVAVFFKCLTCPKIDSKWQAFCQFFKIFIGFCEGNTWRCSQTEPSTWMYQ